MNLLPIPVVDGGQVVLCGLEGLRRKPMPVKFQLVYQQVGFYLVVALMVLAVFNDCWGLILEWKNRIP
jgi:regulator of sigma E protease